MSDCICPNHALFNKHVCPCETRNKILREGLEKIVKSRCSHENHVYDCNCDFDSELVAKQALAEAEKVK